MLMSETFHMDLLKAINTKFDTFLDFLSAFDEICKLEVYVGPKPNIQPVSTLEEIF